MSRVHWTRAKGGRSDHLNARRGAEASRRRHHKKLSSRNLSLPERVSTRRSDPPCNRSGCVARRRGTTGGVSGHAHPMRLKYSRLESNQSYPWYWELVIDIYNSEPSQLHTEKAILRHSGLPPALKRRHTAPGRISGDHRAHATASLQSSLGTHSRLPHLHATCIERSGAQKHHHNTVRLRSSDFRAWKFPSIEDG